MFNRDTGGMKTMDVMSDKDAQTEAVIALLQTLQEDQLTAICRELVAMVGIPR
jgi:hypothetical protein